MFDRFDLRSIFRAQWRSLSYFGDRGADGTRAVHPDIVARVVLLAVPIAVCGAMWIFDGVLRNATVFLTASTLFSAVLLGVFAQLASLRSRFTADEPTPQDQDQRDVLDESVNHVMAAEIGAIAASILLAVGLGTSGSSTICGPLAWVVSGTLAYVAVVILMLLPNLLYAYTRTNNVDSALSGFGR
ncbi:hypothetical protein [Dietzia sp. KRD202]|nr:hypothetical protein [Dietzia sp. KRD202]